MKRFMSMLICALAAVLALSVPAFASVLPATGDNRPIGIIIGIMVVALVAVVVMSVLSSKKKKKK